MRVVITCLVLAACASPAPATEDGPDARPAADAAPDDAAPEPVPGELRGVWVTRFAYTTQAQLETIIDRAAAANFNAVFFQIRGEGDAYYRSAHEPWARRLTGVLGRDPGWDPLQVAIDRARGHGMELHAYFNVLTGWLAAQAVPVAEGTIQHPLYLHPDWLAVNASGQNADTEYRWLSPGIPAVRAHIAATARDLLAKYDVDGLHLDRIRSPGPAYSHDAVTQAAYDAAKAATPALTWGDFMRAQVEAVVADLHAAVVDVRPSARLSAAVWGIYVPLPGCATSKGYADFHQDSLGWVERGVMDALAPMTYWPIAPGACTDWAALTDGFVAGRAGRQIWAGMLALEGGTAWSFDAVRARIEHARAGGAHGTVMFASTYLDAEPARWDAFVGTAAEPGPFADPMPTPAMSWKP